MLLFLQLSRRSGIRIYYTVRPMPGCVSISLQVHKTNTVYSTVDILPAGFGFRKQRPSQDDLIVRYRLNRVDTARWTAVGAQPPCRKLPRTQLLLLQGCANVLSATALKSQHILYIQEQQTFHAGSNSEQLSCQQILVAPKLRLPTTLYPHLKQGVAQPELSFSADRAACSALSLFHALHLHLAGGA